MSKDKIDEVFEKYLESAFGEKKQAEFKFKQFEYNYKKVFPLNKNAKLLDIGIGRGEMLTCFKNWGYNNYLGIDISKDCVEFCKSLGLNCILVKDVIEFLKNYPEEYDLITLIDVLEHILREKTIYFLKSVKISLKLGGVLIIQVPNLQAPDSNLHMYNDFTHFVGYTEHSLKQVLIVAGFKEFYFQPFEEFVEKNIKTYIKLILRKIIFKKVRFERKLIGNLNPEILTPVFSAIVKKV